jgi:hypothetical protein
VISFQYTTKTFSRAIISAGNRQKVERPGRTPENKAKNEVFGAQAPVLLQTAGNGNPPLF